MIIHHKSDGPAITYFERCPGCGWSIWTRLAGDGRRCCRCRHEWQKPIPKSIECPHCGALHVDEGEWAVKPHKTHLCLSCTKTFTPFDFYTVGVRELPKGTQ
jgi:hypothetical protein